MCRTHEVAEHNSFQSFHVDRSQLDDLFAQQTVELSNTCSVGSCNYGKCHRSNGNHGNNNHSNAEQNDISHEKEGYDDIEPFDNIQDDGNHLVRIKLVNSPICGVVVEESTGQLGHTHSGYKHWFMVGTDSSVFVSLSATTVERLSAELRKCNRCRMCVIMNNIIDY